MNKKVIYTVITGSYDHLFPPLTEQTGWDMVCFTDDAALKSDFWQVRPLPDIAELAALKEDPARSARMVKILPHRFLQEYDYSVYIDANRVLLGHIDTFAGDCTAPLLCLGNTAVDALTAIKKILKNKGVVNPMALSAFELSDEEARLLQEQARRYRKMGFGKENGCPGTAILGRRHNDEKLAPVMEWWAKEVAENSSFDEVVLPVACQKHKYRYDIALTLSPRAGEAFGEAEHLAARMQHVRLGIETNRIETVCDYPENPPPPGGPYGGYPLLLTVGVPVSNQIGTIRRCLEGIKPLLDNLPSELVVVDTGSSDGTVEVCREYGARVLSFPWVDDMSAARNTAVRGARGQWFMSIDDDEWFDDVGPILEFFQGGRHKRCNVAFYNQRNYLTKEMTEQSEHPTPRIAKMRPDLHFEGRIHDTLILPEFKTAYLPAHANHLGFAIEGAAQKAARNVRILRKEVANYPGDLRYAHQLTKEYSVLQYGAEVIRMVYWILSLSRQYSGNERWCKIDVGFALSAFAQAGRNGREFAGYYARFIRLEDYLLVDRCYLAYNAAQVYTNMPNADVCDVRLSLDCCREYFGALRQYAALPSNQQDIHWVGIGVNTMAVHHKMLMARHMCANLVSMERLEELDDFLLSDDGIQAFCGENAMVYRKDVAAWLCAKKRWKTLQALLNIFLKETGGEGLDGLAANILEYTGSDDRTLVCDIIQDALPENRQMKAMLTLERRAPGEEGLSAQFEEAAGYAKSTFYATGRYYRAVLLYHAFRLRLPTGPVFEMMDRDDADHMLRILSDGKGWKGQLAGYISNWWQSVDAGSSPIQRYIALQMAALDFRTKEKDRIMNPEPWLESFKAYVGRYWAWEEQTHAKGLLEGFGAQELPAGIRAVCAAKLALTAIQNKDYTAGMRALKTVIESDPRLKPAALALNERLLAQAKAELRGLSEFETLLAGIKPKLEELVAAGSTAEVLTLLAQIERLAPGDAGVQALRRRAMGALGANSLN